MKLWRWIWLAATLGILVEGFREAMWIVPPDAAQGNVGRIIYYHVPSWAAMGIMFLINLVCSLAYLAIRNRNEGLAIKTDSLAVSSAEVDVIFCTIGLVTGSLWGRAAWGIWWTWDPRPTATLVLWLIYVAYLLLRRFAAGPQMRTLAAVMAIFAYVDVPIVYMSTRWWRTQHPAPVFGGAAGSGMDPSMVGALLWNMLAWFAWGVLILALRYRVERKQQRIAAAEAQRALEG